MFFRMNGELFKRLIALDHGAWVISYDEPGAPQYITAAFLEACEKVEMPEGYRVALEQAKHLTEAEMKRLALIEPLLEDSIYIVDGKSRLAMAKRIAEENGYWDCITNIWQGWCSWRKGEGKEEKIGT